MTVDPNLYITVSVSGLAGLAMVTVAGLSGWREWLALKRQELAGRHNPAAAEPAMPSAASRIEIADLKERIRKLEAIAAGVDL
jgi:thioredoxin reductase